MSTNQLSFEITPEKDTAVHQFLDGLMVELDFLVDLSIEDRKKLVKMGRKNVDFVKRSYRHAQTNPQFLPSYMSLEEYRKDVDLSEWLRKVEKKFDIVVDRLKDTAMLAEAESYQTSRLYYGSAKAAAKAGDEGAEQIGKDLAVHFKKHSTVKEETPPVEEVKE